MELLNVFCSHCLTGIDGVTVDPARVYGALAILIFFALSVYSVIYNHAPWEPQSYGIGFGALLTGFGLGVLAKSSTEPPASSPPP